MVDERSDRYVVSTDAKIAAVDSVLNAVRCTYTCVRTYVRPYRWAWTAGSVADDVIMRMTS